MDEQHRVKACLLEIFKRNGYLDTDRMSQRDFEYIGDEIEKKSGILISASTIKRLSNAAFSRMPQIATLNALANYFDCTNWQEYQASFSGQAPATEQPLERSVTPKKTSTKAPLKWLLLAFPVLAFGYYLYPYTIPIANADKASFSFVKTTPNSIPNTVVFKYNIDAVKADSFFIQQSWDKNRRVRIYKSKYSLTDIYYEPGYHIAKLIANDSIIQAAAISIPTDNWFFYANENVANYTTEYIKTGKFVDSGRLAVRAQDLARNHIDITKEKIFVYSWFPAIPAVNSDSFTMKTRFRMTEIKNNFCPYIMAEVHCQRYFMVVKSTPKGCANEAVLQFGEKVLSGKEQDLSSVCFDVTQWTDLELTVKNKHVTIKINNTEVFSTSYQHTSKLITGLSFQSNGLCEIDNVQVSGLDGTLFYQDAFDGK